MQIDIEHMGPHFTKFHLRGPWPFHPVFHRFTQPDFGDPHDHPWSFRSVILHGGYLEEVYNLDGDPVRLIRREVGDSFLIDLNHIHRIVDLPQGECWTMIIPQEGASQKSGFYQFREDAIYHRFWDEPDFFPWAPR